jgi:hypothetical protein
LHVQAQTCAHHQGAVCIQDPFKAAGSGQPTGRANSKQARVLALLCGPSGATIATVTRSTSWQPHTVRAFLAAVVRKKLGLRLESEKAILFLASGSRANAFASVTHQSRTESRA